MKLCAGIQALWLLLTACAAASAAEWRESRELAAIFAADGREGTFLVYDPAGDIVTGLNRERAERRFPPAATFKIAQALIGLSLGVVEDVNEVLPYGGEPQPFPAWEQDLGLREAIRVSSLPVFQELARRIGLARMREHLALLEYGNQDPGDQVERFWLEGPLLISPLEQAAFLARLARSELPAPDAVQLAVREIILQERSEDWALFAKTGFAAPGAPGADWWVGWVEKEGQIYAFVLNTPGGEILEARERVEFGKTCLKALGIL